ncbi:M50 family metallopeptidase [Actinoplanes oblitus]|uniref:M50 family metallopeptidase n=1 Tax=Actinoplanes oblitus TaxID=3040509 RepID=A0ABY8WFQ9_9ACTN|nr:M50 family metallopeptidase [Actinoplanes oblitus]WIM95913.1 M50 family metallopeptidase [Actinoplanes oblitus]
METTSGLAWTTAVLAAVLVLPLWRFSMYAITLAHEGAHALIGLLTGGKLEKKKIHLYRDGAGATHLDIAGFGRFLSLLAGYLGPSAVGFAGAEMLVHDFSPRAVLILGLVFAGFVLILTRNAFGLLVATGTVALLWLMVTKADEPVQLGVAYVWVWMMLMGGTRQIPNLFWGMRAGAHNDAGMLQSHTHIGDVVWLFVFWLGSISALLYGGALMLRHPL